MLNPYKYHVLEEVGESKASKATLEFSRRSYLVVDPLRMENGKPAEPFVLHAFKGRMFSPISGKVIYSEEEIEDRMLQQRMTAIYGLEDYTGEAFRRLARKMIQFEQKEAGSL